MCIAALKGGTECVLLLERILTDIITSIAALPTAVCLTTYQGDQNDFVQTPFRELVQEIQKGDLKVQVGKIFALKDVVEAHTVMEENRAGGKVVLLV